MSIVARSLFQSNGHNIGTLGIGEPTTFPHRLRKCDCKCGTTNLLHPRWISRFSGLNVTEPSSYGRQGEQDEVHDR